MKRLITSALAVLGFGAVLATGVGQADAAILVDNWTLDVQGRDGLPADPTEYRVEDIDALAFNDAIAHAVTNDANGNGVPNSGELGTVEGRGIIGQLLNDNFGNVAPATFNAATNTVGGNPTWQLTFSFDVDLQFVNDEGDFTHLGPTNTPGTLSIYVDNLSNGGRANPTNGAGFEDGDLIATFEIIPGEGGTLNLATLDGSDDALFRATFLEDGVWFDDSGVDLSTLVAEGLIIGFSDSNFDADPDDDDTIDGLPGGVTGGFACGTSLVDFCAFEDGTFRLQQEEEVPEPASLSLLGAGLLGLAALMRRRASRS